MPVLPLIDLLILIAWTSMVWAFVHKGLWLAFASDFTIFGLTPYDFALGAGICLLFALALAARVWVKAHEPLALRGAHRAPHEDEVLPDIILIDGGVGHLHAALERLGEIAHVGDRLGRAIGPDVELEMLDLYGYSQRLHRLLVARCGNMDRGTRREARSLQGGVLRQP